MTNGHKTGQGGSEEVYQNDGRQGTLWGWWERHPSRERVGGRAEE